MAFLISFLKLKPINPLLLLFTLLYTMTMTMTMGCVDPERLALLDFKKSFLLPLNINGKLSSWNSSEVARNCCRWEGITCDGDTGHVISLDLSGQHLESYQLRPSLLQLQYLRSLDLSDNFNIVMRIPKFIGSLSELTYLDLSQAGFFGTIPPQLGNLSKLQTLNLGGNKLSTDNLQWLSHLSSLQSIDMIDLNLSEARDWVSVIRKLPILSHFSCNFCYFPTQDLLSTPIHHVNSSSSSSLQTLDLSYSHLSAFSLSSLLACNPSNLHLRGLELDPSFLDIFHEDMMSLQLLDISENHLGDGIFNSIGNLCNLSELSADESTINQSLPNILQALSGCASSSLTWLSLTSMNLTGTLPTMLKFKLLTELFLRNNWLDNFPLQNDSLTIFPASLTHLYLEDNNLNGKLTDVHFTNVSHLRVLKLASNPNLGVSFNKNLTATCVDLSYCNLGPSFPSWLLSKNRFEILDISNSKISSTIPIMFWRNLSPSLAYLNLSSNSLYGTLTNIPFQIFHFGTVVDLSLNALSGSIPFFLFMADELYLSDNNFSRFSSIPYPYNSSNSPAKINSDPYWGSVPSVVDLSNNVLSGSIPHWLGFKVPNLGALFLTNNNLSGTIPDSIGHAAHLYVLSLRNNSFSGSLPSSLKNCSQLRILDLDWNRFSGSIPSWIGENLKILNVLTLRSNNLTGILPTSLCHLHSLQILDLSYNLLSKNIPSCIQNFTRMARDVKSILNDNVPYMGEGISVGGPLEEVSYFNAYITWKSRVWKFQSTLHLVKLIDLSSNNFMGEIPTGLASLVELDSLDLSCNSLQGSIPEQIGQLKSLQVLNLSHNRLHGQIPPSLSEISSLGMLDLSHNNLSGRIPKGTQLQSFDPSDFAANPELCGLPLRNCPGDSVDPGQGQQPSPIDESETEDKWSDKQCFYGGLGVGFAFGFLGILGSLTWITKWRYAFFRLPTRFGEWILLVAALHISKISRN